MNPWEMDDSAFAAASAKNPWEMDNADIADYESLVAKKRSEVARPAGKSKVVSGAREQGSALVNFLRPIVTTAVEMAAQIPAFLGETLSPNVSELQEQQGNDFSILSGDYLKAAGKDLFRVAPFMTAPIGGTLPATAGTAAKLAYPALRGAAESGMYAVGSNALGDNVSLVDAMTLGGILGGGVDGGVARAGKAVGAVTPFARNAMAKMANVSPEALDAYSSAAGRANIAKAFGAEEGIAKDLTQLASPGFMEYMPETAAFNSLVGELRTPSNLGFVAKDLAYNPQIKRGGGALYEGQQRAKEEIAKNYRAPLLNKDGSAYRVVSPAQLNEQRKQFGLELDNAWNAIERGVPTDAIRIGKTAYASMRNRLMDVAEKEGMSEARKLLAAQAKKLGAKDDFLHSWIGNRTDKRDAELAIRETIAGVMTNPSIRKISKMEDLHTLDNVLGTDFASSIADASYARQLASKGARPGSFSAAIFPKYETGAWKTGATLLGGSPITGGRYLENLRALESMANATKGKTSAASSLAWPMLRTEE